MGFRQDTQDRLDELQAQVKGLRGQLDHLERLLLETGLLETRSESPYLLTRPCAARDMPSRLAELQGQLDKVKTRFDRLCSHLGVMVLHREGWYVEPRAQVRPEHMEED